MLVFFIIYRTPSGSKIGSQGYRGGHRHQNRIQHSQQRDIGGNGCHMVKNLGQILPEEFRRAVAPAGVVPGISADFLEVLPKGIFIVRFIIFPGAHLRLIDKCGIVFSSLSPGVNEVLEQIQQNAQGNVDGACGQELSECRAPAHGVNEESRKGIRRKRTRCLRQEGCKNEKQEPFIQFPKLFYGPEKAAKCGIFMLLCFFFLHQLILHACTSAYVCIFAYDCISAYLKCKY